MAQEGSEQPRLGLAERLRRQRQRHLARPKIFRGAFVVAGFIVTLAGLALLILPGPAFVVIPIGLAMLALEFAWAERLLERALERADTARQQAAGTSSAVKILAGIAIAAAVAAVVTGLLVWDPAFLPF